MSKIFSIEPAIDPKGRPTFLLDWELTLKCNLDCSYCESGPTGAHDNSTAHPPLDECLKTIDFMYEYADIYMEHKPRWSRAVVLNVYGGESLVHPDIVEILKQTRQRHAPYKDRWPLTITCTTNAVIGNQRMNQVIDYVDDFIVSYHSETLIKQKEQVKSNLLLLKNRGKNVKCIVLMHSNQDRWEELIEVIEFCQKHDIKYIPKQLDGPINSNYNSQQVTWFKNLWQKQTPAKGQLKQESLVNASKIESQGSMLSQVGRSCCGGRLMCTNENLREPVYFVPDNNYQGWSCSVNWFFLYVKQFSKLIYVNKDCKMNFDGNVGPIGTLDNYQVLLDTLRTNLKNNTMPIITCAKSQCLCGLCAPKAKDKNTLVTIMKKHVTKEVWN